MISVKKVTLWGLLAGFVSLFLGVVAVVLADFGMPGWFFLLTQVWFWTLGLPSMLGVIAVVALWGVPEWTALPLWAFAICASLVAISFQCGFFILLRRIVQRFAGGRV